MKKSFTFLFVALLLCVSAFGQATVTSTTLSAPITATTGCFNVASATGIIAPGFNTPNSATGNVSLLFINTEQILPTSVNGTYICGVRGYNKTLASGHVNASKVWVGPPVAFNNQDAPELSACLRTALQYVPYISVASGSTYDCLGVTTAGQWVKTSAPGMPKVGSIVASVAGAITITGTTFHVSGTAAVTGINVPAGWAPGMSINIIPDGTFTWTTAGNISLLGTAVVNKTIIFVWDGAKWNPSVVA